MLFMSRHTKMMKYNGHICHIFALKLLLMPVLCDAGATLVPNINVTSCGQGHMRWSMDRKCYKLYSQGPCHDPDQVYLPSSSSASFADCQTFVNKDNEVSSSTNTTSASVLLSESVSTSNENVTKCDSKHGWPLPTRVKLLSHQEKNCLSQEKVQLYIYDNI